MSTHRIALLGSALLVAIAAQPIWGDPVNTAIRVTTTADDVVIDGNCSLREAIIAANTDTAIDRCPAGSGTDSLLVPEGTYTLSRRTKPTPEAEARAIFRR